MLIKTKGAILRSMVRWHEEGKRNTKYFYSLEKRPYEPQSIHKFGIYALILQVAEVN